MALISRPRSSPKVAFNGEDDVRKWIKERATSPFWIEPTRGSTFGTPDVWIVDGDGTWLELKHGKVCENGLLHYKVRAPQKREIERKRLHPGIRIGLLVGFGDRLFVTSDPDDVNRGWVAVGPRNSVAADDPRALTSITSKIRSDCARPWIGRRRGSGGEFSS